MNKAQRLAVTIGTGIILIIGASPVWAGSFDEQMNDILKAYLKIPKALAADQTAGVSDAAKNIAKLAKSLNVDQLKGEHAKHFGQLPHDIGTSATSLSKAADIQAMRDELKKLSKPMAMWATMSRPEGVSVMYCSMAPGSWLQKNDTTIANPYYGAKMLRCGDIVGGEGSPPKGDKKMKGHGDHRMHH